MKAVTEILRDRDRRFRVFSLLSMLLAFFLPILGWSPILLLWLVHLVCLSRETSVKSMRIFYGCMMVLASALLLWNLSMGIHLLTQL